MGVLFCEIASQIYFIKFIIIFRKNNQCETINYLDSIYEIVLI